MATQNIKVVTGNRIVVEFDGKVVGLIQSIQPSDSYAMEPASGLGDIHVQEHVPTRAQHRVEVTNMTLFSGSMRAAGIVPENGDAALAGTVLDICIYSKDTGKVMRKYASCSYDSGSVDVTAHRILMARGSFLALDVSGTGI